MRNTDRVIKELKARGWRFDSVRGSHHIFKQAGASRSISVPVHSKDISPNFAKEILKIRADIPIIVCTGHNDALSPEIARAAGIRAFLMKPMLTKEMAETVRRVLDVKRIGPKFQNNQ